MTMHRLASFCTAQRRAPLISLWCHPHYKFSQRAFSASSSVNTIPLQPGEIVTRVAPSQRVPGLRGVYITRAIKKFHHIEVLPAAAAATTSRTAGRTSKEHNTEVPRSPNVRKSSSIHSNSCGINELSPEKSDGVAITQAPPLVLNLAFAPRHHISLRRFLALRHMFSSSDYLHAATEDGWYLIAPSSAAPLCVDIEGLEKWAGVHHRRYLTHHSTAPSSPSLSKQGQRRAKGSSREARLAKHAELAKLEAALDNGEELTEAQLCMLAANEKKRDAMDHETYLEAEDDEAKPDGEDSAERGTDVKDLSAEQHMNAAAATEAATPPRLRSLPPLITEAHLFEINDGVFWEMPPSDDLASHDYWKDHRRRMALYESTGDTDAAEQREALLETIRSDPRARGCSERELHTAAEALFQTLKQKANVMLSVDSESGLLSLVPLQDLKAGDELFLHYGREWWTGRLLSSLLLAVSDEQIPHIRWVEQLFGHESDKNELFPLLIPAHQQRNRKARKQHVLESKSSTEGHCGPLVLYNTVTRSRATDAAVLAFAIRRSCLNQDFFDRLVLGNPARAVPPLFLLSEPDAEVPMRALRKVLLNSLRGLQEEGEQWSAVASSDNGKSDDGNSSTSSSSQAKDASAAQGVRRMGHDDSEADDVFSV